MSGFNGEYLIKVGTYKIPLSIMKYGTYQSSPAQRQDLDSYRDANGILHRTVLSHVASKIEFETIPMSVVDFRGFMDSLVAQYTNGPERKVTLEYYEEEYGRYITGTFYLPGTLTFPMLNKEVYDSCRIAFIEY